ncbi:uncharacterized protein K02A2.6-like [Sycon ciliatum]|uniref:uncharacterized protein K02A2.6-like n=1 Tax=Sycon ciliatum TaxID=27933 RepID=UPI0031F69AC1
MALLGNLGPFTSTDADDWESYLARLDQFYKANKIEDGRKKSVFLTVVGESVFRLLVTLIAPATLDDKSLSELRQTLTAHFSPKRLTIAERYKFWSRSQQASESFHDYAAELRRLAKTCDFGNGLEDAIRDRFVCGIRDAVVCKKLLTIDALTLETALKTAAAQEVVDREAARLMAAGRSTSESSDVHAVWHKRQPPAPRQRGKSGASASSTTDGAAPCYRCGNKDHAPSQCRFKASECHYCHKRGHLEKVCRTKKGDQHQTNFVCEEHEVGDVYSVESRPKLTVNVMLDGVETTMVLDTGAAVSLMSRETWDRTSDKQLEPANIKLRSYTGDEINVLGQATVEVCYDGRTTPLPLLIVEGEGATLLGRNWLPHVRLDWSSVFGVDEPTDGPDLERIVADNATLFDGHVGELRTGASTLHLKEDARPVFRRPYSVPYAVKPLVEEQLRKMEQQHIIEPVKHSEWATPVVAVPKPDGSVRLCGDYKVTVNPQLRVDQHPLPTAQDIFSSLNGCKYFAKLDLSQAYLQVPLDKASQKMTTINTHKGLYQFNRLPYGIASAPAVFQGIMDKLLVGLEGVSKYLDDILIAAPTRRLLLERLNTVLSILLQAGLKLKKSKCMFFSDSVQYLGFKIDASGLHATDEKVQAVQNARAPTNVTELKSFLGLVNYYGQFIENLASLAQPLYDLQKRNTVWKWQAPQQQAFRALKSALSAPPVLVHYSPSLPLRLTCDASGTGIGAVLSHVMPEGQEQPIAYASRSLTTSERNYSQLEREALAIVFGVTKFHLYLYGRHFNLVTDNRPLAVIFGPKRGIPSIAAMRLQRWAVTLSAYQYDVMVKTTEANANADYLSRMSLDSHSVDVCEVSEILTTHQDQLPVLAADISAETAKDIVLKQVLQHVANGWPETVPSELKPFHRIAEELTVVQGCLQRGFRTVVPSTLQPRLLQELHIAHPGMVRMKALARNHVWWPGLDSDVERAVRSCHACQVNRNRDQPVEVTRWPNPAAPWSRIHADFAGPMEGRMYLIVTDAFSKWLEVIPMSSTTSKTTIAEFRKLFAAYGSPDAIGTDNGPQFTSVEWSNFMAERSIIHLRSAPYFPATNGAAERCVQTFKAALLSEKRGLLSWTEALQTFLERYRSTPHATTGETPSALFLQRELKTRLHLVQPQAKNTTTAACHQPPAKGLDEGSAVYARMFNQPQKWSAGTVLQRKGTKSFEVKLANGVIVRRHVDQLRVRDPATTPELPSDPEKVVQQRDARTPSRRHALKPQRYRD